jgi:DNA-binding MarR family transcriptional regulator
MTVATPSELLAALRHFGLENDRLDAAVARRLGAPPVEFKAMDHLHEAGELTPGQLAERLCLTSGAVTALLDRLERLGWAKREPHPHDRRSVIVRRVRSDENSEALGIYMELAARLERLAAEMSPAERDAAIRFLEEAGREASSRADVLRAQRGSAEAPTPSPAPGSPPTPAA